MGHSDRQPTTATALALIGVSPKLSPATIVLAILVAIAWAAVIATLMTGAGIAWTIAAVGAALSVAIAAGISWGLDGMRAIVGGHAACMETATKIHGKDLRNHVMGLTWMAESQARGVRRAYIDADRAYENPSPSDTGPFWIANSAG